MILQPVWRAKRLLMESANRVRFEPITAGGDDLPRLPELFMSQGGTGPRTMSAAARDRTPAATVPSPVTVCTGVTLKSMPVSVTPGTAVTRVWHVPQARINTSTTTWMNACHARTTRPRAPAPQLAWGSVCVASTTGLLATPVHPAWLARSFPTTSTAASARVCWRRPRLSVLANFP